MLLFAEQARARCLEIFRQRLDTEGARVSDALLHKFIGIIATDTHVRRIRPESESPGDNVHLHIMGLRAAMKSRHGWNTGYYHPVLQFEIMWYVRPALQ